jgi:RimJ/RimL family protein N-acetyltransferase
VLSADRLPTIEVRRVRLRWLTEHDVDALFAVFSDPQVMRYWSSPPLADRSVARQLLQRIQDGFRQQSFFQWGVALRDEDRVVGTCTLFRLDTDNGRAEVGFALGREHWKLGYMSEALPALLVFAFESLGLRRLEADVDPRNRASIRLLERLGFRKEGQLRERWNVAGETQDSLLYGLLRREWNPDSVCRPSE